MLVTNQNMFDVLSENDNKNKKPSPSWKKEKDKRGGN